jgi:hypothetical protein
MRCESKCGRIVHIERFDGCEPAVYCCGKSMRLLGSSVREMPAGDDYNLENRLKDMDNIFSHFLDEFDLVLIQVSLQNALVRKAEKCEDESQIDMYREFKDVIEEIT